MSDDKRAKACSAFSNVNEKLEQRRRIPSLTKMVPYLITKVVALAEHKEYGQGYQVHLRDSDKKHFFVTLPNRIVQKVGLRNFDQYREDIEQKRPPFLVFKGKAWMGRHLMSPEVVRASISNKPLVFEDPTRQEQDDFAWLDEMAAGPSDDLDDDENIVVEDGEKVSCKKLKPNPEDKPKQEDPKDKPKQEDTDDKGKQEDTDDKGKQEDTDDKLKQEDTDDKLKQKK
ncbi:Disintegrin and metalloproteinase domain-containing protein 30 [Frankliniella fusca]|uniref:Disintegrin and metalloproteinase domain-containing protein 30 n=1 Tax=Frankliniella fusca TaxID=407009 RepID=A0AAE1H9Z3_9NEOP|nr:Disintegrin and metalloproteinase domain-containing protein 30 [Frankliniella fusca]